MTTNFRALCAELVTVFKDESTYTQKVEALDRARAVLATPPPEPPTDEELWAIWNNHDGPIPAILRAALERWGHAYPTR